MNQILQIEFNSLTEQQKELHTREGKEEIISDFYKRFYKCSWNVNNLMKLKQNIISENEVSYTVSCIPHILRYTYLRVVLPEIRVKESLKEKYRIAWTNNIGNNIVVKAIFQENEKLFHTLDSFWLDIYPQFFSKGYTNYESYLNSIGSINELTTFSSSLPRKVLNIFQPWFYSFDPALGFPIFYKGKETKAEHVYFFRRKISELLRVEAFENNNWRKLKNYEIQELLSSIIDIEDEDFSVKKEGLIQIPELWGKYHMIGEPEIKFHMECQKERVYYIRDIFSYDSDNLVEEGSSFSIELNNNYPCLAIFWLLENNNSRNLNSYSNYTNNIDGKGSDTISLVSIYHGNTAKFENMNIDHFYLGDTRISFPYSPRENGYYAYSIATNINSFHSESGLVFSKLKSRIKFDLSRTKNKEKNYYNVKVRLLVLRKLKVVKENDKYEFILE